MSLGSRILKRGRVALSANLASTPREPLLFLYPQWIRRSSTAAEAASGLDGGLPVGSIQPNIPRQPLPPKPASANDDEISLQQRFDKPKIEPSNPDVLARTTKIKAILKATGGFPMSSKEAPSANQDPSVVERQVRKIRQTEENAKKNELADRRIRSAYQNWRREVLRSWLPDWRVILADLVKHTPQHGKWLDQGLELVIPLDSLPRLVHGIDDYILDIGFQYGVSIRVAERDEDTQQYRRFIISGPASSISKTTADVLRIAPTTEMKTASSLLPSRTDDLSLEGALDKETSLIAQSDEPEVDIRYNLTDPRIAKLKIPPEQIPRPKIWTHMFFLDYLRLLTASSVPNHLNRFGFRTSQDHNTAVTEIIRNLFKDPECKPVISRTACNVAMEYFVRINRLEDVRKLFVHMEMLKLSMVPETFNIMLRGAAKNEDLHNFHFILHLMLRRGFAPNGYTWIAFMMAHPDIRVKLHILTAMKEKGLTAHPSIMKEVSQQLVQPEIDSSLDQNLSQAQFVAHMDSRYGLDWLSINSANRALHSLGARGLISRCWEFLNFMNSRFIQYDNYSINTILYHCKQATNLTGAVELLRSLPSRGDFWFVPDEETYRILFELAWRSRSYNLARVVWRYASLSAATTRAMRTRVFASMLYASSKDTRATPRERWEQFAGPVIFGSNHHGNHPAHVWARMNSTESTPESTLDKTSLGDNESSGPPSKAMDAEATASETPKQDGAQLEGSQFGASETQVTGAEGATRKVEGSAGLSTAESPEMAGTNSKPNEGQDTKNNFFALRIQKFTPIGILDPEESVVQNQMQLWKKTREELKLKLLLDLEIYKEWRPVKPFSEMLVDALEHDTDWRENGDYAEMDMQYLIRNAVPVRITMKKDYVNPAEHEWK
jgi:pentatricopeptide repeat protein